MVINIRESFVLDEVSKQTIICDENTLVFFHIDGKTNKGLCTQEITPQGM